MLFTLRTGTARKTGWIREAFAHKATEQETKHVERKSIKKKTQGKSQE